MEFKVNNAKQNYSMKLGEGGEAFFVFETSDEIPESLQTSPVVSPATSPQSLSLEQTNTLPTLQEPEFLDLNLDSEKSQNSIERVPSRPALSNTGRAKSDLGKPNRCSFDCYNLRRARYFDALVNKSAWKLQC